MLLFESVRTILPRLGKQHLVKVNAALLKRNKLYTRDASKNWKLAGSDRGCRLTTKEPAANAVLLDYISSKKWEDVVDFDDHLDDITKDWLNPELFK